MDAGTSSSTAEEDASLMQRVHAASDEAALAALMQRWERPVKAVLGRIVLNATEAEDLAQETFARLWLHRGRYTPGRPVKPWILGIAVNLARNRLRWWRRRPSVALEEWEEVPESNSIPAAGASALEQKERAAAVRDAIAVLPDQLREALVLFEYERLSQAEIAQVLGVTPKAVENRIARARERLRASLHALR